MWALIVGLALAAPPPSAEVGRVRTSGGLAGPDWGVWGDLSANFAEKSALRGGLEARFIDPRAGASAMLEQAVGPYWVQGFAAGGGTLIQALGGPLAPQLGWRAEVGTRFLFRWGVGMKLAAASDGERVDGRLGMYLEW